MSGTAAVHACLLAPHGSKPPVKRTFLSPPGFSASGFIFAWANNAVMRGRKVSQVSGFGMPLQLLSPANLNANSIGYVWRRENQRRAKLPRRKVTEKRQSHVCRLGCIDSCVSDVGFYRNPWPLLVSNNKSSPLSRRKRNANLFNAEKRLLVACGSPNGQKLRLGSVCKQ